MTSPNSTGARPGATTARAPAGQQQPQPQGGAAPAQTTTKAASGASCQFIDAGDGNPINTKEGATFTDSRGETYTVRPGCTLDR